MSHPVSISRFVGLRYLRARRNDRFVSILSLISIVGIALGVVTLITVISVMNGFQAELRGRLLSMASHLVISQSTTTKAPWAEIKESLEHNELVVDASRFIEADVILNRDKNVAPAVMRGVDSATLIKMLSVDGPLNIRQERLLDEGGGVVLGRELASVLGVYTGETVSILVPEVVAGGAGVVPRRRELRVMAILQVNVPQYDSTLVLLHEDVAADFLSGIQADAGLRIMLTDMDEVFDLIPQLQARYPDLKIESWASMHQSFFTAIKIEKIVMFVVLLMVIAVAAFNIIATLAVTVSEKQSDIAILKTLGATEATIRSIFLVQGGVIGLLGIGFGVLIGVPLAIFFPEVIAGIETLFGFKVFSPDMFYISKIPSKLLWGDLLWVVSFAFLTTVLATWQPARRAAKVEPARALRYE